MIKSYTDLEQSKKLAVFLPLESADLSYMSFDNHITLCSYIKMINDGFNKDDVIPAWSLSALLGILKDYTLQTNTDGSVFVVCYSKKPMRSDAYDNPVDACVTMIEKLNELKML